MPLLKVNCCAAVAGLAAVVVLAAWDAGMDDAPTGCEFSAIALRLATSARRDKVRFIE